MSKPRNPSSFPLCAVAALRNLQAPYNPSSNHVNSPRTPAQSPYDANAPYTCKKYKHNSKYKQKWQNNKWKGTRIVFGIYFPFFLSFFSSAIKAKQRISCKKKKKEKIYRD
ncbi:hypothetical protein V6Z11_A07G034500 [Gossypium hirsutum]